VKVRVLSSAVLRATPGAEVRYVTGGSPDRIIGTLERITVAA
jgi:hypothetical protein